MYQRLLIVHSPVEDDDVLSGSDPRRWTVNWPTDETLDRQQTFRRTPLTQDIQHLPQHSQQDGAELGDIFSPY